MGQREVICSKWPVSREEGLIHASSSWVVEAAHHPALEAVEAASLRASFLETFILSHKLMFASNNKMGKIGKYLAYYEYVCY
jgi:dolichyl-phosphate-mannose--protein O-mannosyl transferase